MMDHCRAMPGCTPPPGRCSTVSQRAKYVYDWVKIKAGRLYLKAVASYVPQQYPGRIMLFRASESLELNPVDHPMGWGPPAAEGVDQYIINGTHCAVDKRSVIDVTARLRESLDQGQAVR